MTHLQQEYQTVIQPKLTEELTLKNKLATPRLLKMTVNVGWGELRGNQALQKSVEEGLSLVTGQKPIVTRAKKAIAGFKLRQNEPIGYKVTLRGRRMYDFLERLITYIFPRLRDFQGLSQHGFDGHGNYSFGLREQTVFPEIPFQSTDRTWGMQITLVTSARDNRQAKALLKHLGFPLSEETKALE